MSNIDPPLIPPLLPMAKSAVAAIAQEAPLGSATGDTEPVRGLPGAADALLRHPRRIVYWLRQPGSTRLTGVLLAIALLCSVVYGVVVGSFAMHDQLWAAPVKLACGLLVSAFICLPSLYIFSCLGGARTRLTEVCGLVAGLLALMTILLIGFAPVAWIFSQSTESVPAMGALHLVFWFIATGFGLRFLQAGFTHCGGSRAGLRLWIGIFLLVMMQMTAALRPLVGTSDTFLPQEKRFFLGYWLENLQK